ncbi:hypothetical protein BVY02_01190 [bacterium J17]|nr:hypothetical protein BVY02_01190 [bacterium J17]
MARRKKNPKLTPLQKEELKLAALGGKTQEEAMELIDDLDVGALERYLLSDKLGRAIAHRFAYNLEISQEPKKEKKKANKLVIAGGFAALVPALFLFNSLSPSSSHSYSFTDSIPHAVEKSSGKTEAVETATISEESTPDSEEQAIKVQGTEKWFDDVTLDQHQRLVYSTLQDLKTLLIIVKEAKRLEHAYHPITGDKEPLQRIYSMDLRDEWEFVTSRSVMLPLDKTKEYLDHVQVTAEKISDGYYAAEEIPPVARIRNWAIAEKKRLEPVLRIFQALDRRAYSGRAPHKSTPTITDVIQKEEQRALKTKLAQGGSSSTIRAQDAFISHVDEKVPLNNREIWKLAYNPSALALLAPIVAVGGQKNASQWRQDELLNRYLNKNNFETFYNRTLAQRFATTGSNKTARTTHVKGYYTSKNLASAEYEYSKRNKAAQRKFKVTLFQLFQIVCERNQSVFLSEEEAKYFLHIEQAKKHPRQFIIERLRHRFGPTVKSRKPPMWVRNLYLANRGGNRL